MCRTPFVDVFNSIYENFQISLSCLGKLSNAVKVNKGVLQGDPSSPLFFNICFNSLMKVLESPNYKKMGYIWGNRDSQICNWLQYADDAAIVARDQKSAQGLACFFEAWCNWAKMYVRLDKCSCFGMVKKQSKIYTQVLPNISLSTGNIPAIPIDDHFVYLGRIYDFSLDDDLAKKSLISKMEQLLKIISDLKIRPQTKLRIFQLFIPSQFSFPLRVEKVFLVLEFLKI